MRIPDLFASRIPVREVTLHRIHTVAQRRIDSFTLREMGETQFGVFIDHATGDLVMQLRASLLAAATAQRTVTYPATWWDAFKLRWFTARLLRRFPAQMTHIDFRMEQVFPDLCIPGHKAVIHIPEPVARFSLCSAREGA